MTPADVGRALAAAPWWEWRAEMLGEDPDGTRWRVACGSLTAEPGSRVVLDDPTEATAGVLVGMLLEAAPESAIWYGPKSDGWRWRRDGRASLRPADIQAPTLAEAAGRALLAVTRG